MAVKFKVDFLHGTTIYQRGQIHESLPADVHSAAEESGVLEHVANEGVRPVPGTDSREGKPSPEPLPKRKDEKKE